MTVFLVQSRGQHGGDEQAEKPRIVGAGSQQPPTPLGVSNSMNAG